MWLALGVQAQAGRALGSRCLRRRPSFVQRCSRNALPSLASATVQNPPAGVPRRDRRNRASSLTIESRVAVSTTRPTREHFGSFRVTIGAGTSTRTRDASHGVCNSKTRQGRGTLERTARAVSGRRERPIRSPGGDPAPQAGRAVPPSAQALPRLGLSAFPPASSRGAELARRVRG